MERPQSDQQSHLSNIIPALTSVAQLVEHHPAKRKVTGLIPVQGTCGHPLSLVGACVKGNQSMFLPSLSPSLPLTLKKNNK